MSKLTEYLMGKRDKFIGLELIYNDLKVRDFMDKVDLEGLSEVRKLSTEESKEIMKMKEVKAVSMGESNVSTTSISERVEPLKVTVGDNEKSNVGVGVINLEEVKEEVKEIKSYSLKQSKLGKKLDSGEVDMSRRKEISKGLEDFLETIDKEG